MSQKLIELKQRMRSVENIQTITQTMATVAAAKLARTRFKASGLQVYSSKMRELALRQSRYVQKFADHKLEEYSPLMEERKEINKVALFVIASDIGMCGNYNGQVCRLGHKFVEDKQKEKKNVFLVTKGLKAEEYFRKRTNFPIIHKYAWRTEGVSLKDAEELLNLMLALYKQREVDEVYSAYTRFQSAIKREPQLIRLLPLRIEREEKVKEPEFESWIYEPNAVSLLEELIPTYLRIQVYDLLLESYASEQGARMMAMEEASDRAEKTLQGLKVQYNKMRRDLVTLDLLGIISASKVLEKEAIAKVGF